MTYRIRNAIFRLIHPGFWIQNNPSSPVLDEVLNLLMDQNVDVCRTGNFTVQLGGVEVWVGNWPYAYGYVRSISGDDLPYPLTRVRLKRYIAQTLADKALRPTEEQDQ